MPLNSAMSFLTVLIENPLALAEGVFFIGVASYSSRFFSTSFRDFFFSALFSGGSFSGGSKHSGCNTHR